MPCAPSPPSAFCQEKVATSSFCQSSGCANAAEVASQIARPARSAGIQSRVGDADARCGAVPGEHHVVRPVDGGKIGQFAITGLEDRDVLEPQLPDDIVHPAFAEGFPGQHGDRTRAEQRPQRHLDRAGVGCRHDPDPVAGRNLQYLAGEIDGAPELGLAKLGAMRAAERGVGEGLKAPAGVLGAGAGREMRVVGRTGGIAMVMALSFQIGAPRWGGVSRRRT